MKYFFHVEWLKFFQVIHAKCVCMCKNRNDVQCLEERIASFLFSSFSYWVTLELSNLNSICFTLSQSPQMKDIIEMNINGSNSFEIWHYFKMVGASIFGIFRSVLKYYRICYSQLQFEIPARSVESFCNFRQLNSEHAQTWLTCTLGTSIKPFSI